MAIEMKCIQRNSVQNVFAIILKTQVFGQGDTDDSVL